jgi:hypothetical protein
MKTFLCSVLFINVLACKAAEFPVPSGRFTFDGKPNIGTVVLSNAVIRDSALYLNGVYSSDYWRDGITNGGYTAVFRPTKIDYQAFTIVVKLKPESFSVGRNTLLVGGASCRWLALTIDEQGHLELSLNNRRFRHTVQDVTMQTNQWIAAAVSFSLNTRKVVIYLNGKRVDEVSLQEDFVLDVMNDQKWKDYDQVWTFTNYSYCGTFQGLVAGLLAFDTILTDDQVRQLFPKR